MFHGFGTNFMCVKFILKQILQPKLWNITQNKFHTSEMFFTWKSTFKTFFTLKTLQLSIFHTGSNLLLQKWVQSWHIYYHMYTYILVSIHITSTKGWHRHNDVNWSRNLWVETGKNSTVVMFMSKAPEQSSFKVSSLLKLQK
jgi:hypothetical protein